MCISYLALVQFDINLSPWVEINDILLAFTQWNPLNLHFGIGLDFAGMDFNNYRPFCHFFDDHVISLILTLLSLRPVNQLVPIFTVIFLSLFSDLGSVHFLCDAVGLVHLGIHALDLLGIDRRQRASRVKSSLVLFLLPARGCKGWIDLSLDVHLAANFRRAEGFKVFGWLLHPLFDGGHVHKLKLVGLFRQCNLLLVQFAQFWLDQALFIVERVDNGCRLAVWRTVRVQGAHVIGFMYHLSIEYFCRLTQLVAAGIQSTQL